MLISKYTREIYNGNLVIAANTKFGGYVKTNANYYTYIKNGVLAGNELRQLLIGEPNVDSKISALYNELCNKIIFLDEDDIEAFDNEKLDDVIISVTNNCNLSCVHCCANAGGVQQFDDLSLETVKKIINKIAQLKPERLQITGGEPLLRKDILEILKYIKSTMDCKVALSTNLTLFDYDVFKELINYVESISVSLDGYDDESVQKIRGANVYDLVLENLQKLKSLGFRNISLSMVRTKYVDDFSSIEKFNALCANLDVKPLIRIFSTMGRAVNRTDMEPNEVYYIGEKNEFDVTARICNPAKREIYIEYNGDVYPCQALVDEKYLLGKVLELDFNNLSNDCILELMPFNNDCKDCNVNLFCFGCIERCDAIRKNKAYCLENKTYLNKLIWKATD